MTTAPDAPSNAAPGADAAAHAPDLASAADPAPAAAESPAAGATRGRVGVVLSPRERWSSTDAVIARLAEVIDPEVPVVIVLAGAPGALSARIRRVAATEGWTLVERDGFLPPNACRILGLDALGDVERVLFVDNDFLAGPQMLDHLMRAMDETGAGAVTPLVLQGTEDDPQIHITHGDMVVEVTDDGRRILCSTHTEQHRPAAELDGRLERSDAGFVEFHCVLVDRAALDDAGGLDPRLTGTREHLDLSLTLLGAGHRLVFEPEARGIYEIPRALEAADLPFYLTRWSESWCATSHRRFHAKHDLDNPLAERLSIMKTRRSYAFGAVARPLRKVIGRRGARQVVRVLSKAETIANRRLIGAPPIVESGRTSR